MKNFKLLPFLLLFLTSCLIKKQAEEIKFEDTGLSIVSRGFFTVKDQLYFSNGKDIYCGFKDWDMVEEYKVYYPSKFGPIDVPKEPELMKFVPICTHDLLKIEMNSKDYIIRNPDKNAKK
jgi:hypothetical protein